MQEVEPTTASRVREEIAWASSRPNPLVLLSCTAREGVDFAITPRRSALGYNCIGMMFGSEKAVLRVLPLLAGGIRNVLVDVEGKKSFDLVGLAKAYLSGATIIPCKPNDATLEAFCFLLRKYAKMEIPDKSVVVYAMGNLGTKIAMRLAECGARVTVVSRDRNKCARVCDAMNLVLPRYCRHKIVCAGSLADLERGGFDILVSCASGHSVISAQTVSILRPEAIAVDVGIDNFSPEFYLHAERMNLRCFRLDTRLGFPYMLLPLLENSDPVFVRLCGSAILKNGVRIVSGGCVGERGNVIVDNVENPAQIIGVANGTGGILPDDKLDADLRLQIEKVVAYIQSRVEARD